MRVLSVLLPLLLCMVVGLNQVRAEVQAVKLCGREFLRAVVYTCGGSRWRRLLSEPEQLEDIGEQPLSSMEDLKASLGSDFSRRDVKNMLTTVCCQLGCSKSDLTYLC
ncbi:insulin-like 5a [Esox lucius]|uniref:Insulin-like domain-containing protein n=1 Tax=Esox lucius TaxID=8010 RepID=A0A3P9AL47_ESOLU|nr:insulin-like 5a [Esox lucius]